MGKRFSRFEFFAKVALSLQVTTCAFATESNFASENVEFFELTPVSVSAQRRIQPIDDVPIAISVIDQEEVDQRHAKNLSEIQQLAPSFSVIQNGITKAISIRGIGGGGRNIGFETRTGVYIDGVYVGQSPALESPIFDIEHIEILRGPQGFLFGRNTDAGAVNITTKPPSNKFEGYARTGIGNLHYFENTLNVSGPINQDLLGKLTLNSETRDGFIDNTINNDALKDLNRFSTRGQLRYFASDQLTLDLSLDYSNIHHTDFLPQAVTGLFNVPLNNVDKDKVSLNKQPYAKNEIFGGALKADYLMQSGHTITSISAVRRTKNLQGLDTDHSAVDLIHTDFSDDYFQVTEELRIASPDDQKVRYVAGLYAVHETAKTNRVAKFGNETSTLIQLPTLAFQIPFDAAFGILPNARIPHTGTIETNAIALFGALDIDLRSDLTLNLGARYNKELKQLTFNSDGSESGALGIANLNNYRDDSQEQFFSPMAGLTFALTNDIKAYAKYSRGFKSGGWNVDFLSAAQINDGFKFDKETVDSVELGLKGETDNHRWQYDVSLFQQRYHDFQVFQFADLGSGQTVLQLRNAAQAESKGIEGSVRGLLTQDWRVSSGLSVLDAHFVDFPNGSPVGNAEGQRLPDAPRFSARLSTDYTLNAPSFNGKFNLFIEDAYQTESFSGLSSDQSISKLESRHLVNMQTKFTTNDKHWEIAIWVRNLFDKHYAKAKGRDFFGNQLALYGDPRLYRVTGQYNF